MCIPPDPAKAWPVAVLKIPAEVEARSTRAAFISSGNKVRQKRDDAARGIDAFRNRLRQAFAVDVEKHEGRRVRDEFEEIARPRDCALWRGPQAAHRCNRS